MFARSPLFLFAWTLLSLSCLAVWAGTYPPPQDFFRNGPQIWEVYSAQSKPSPFDESQPLESRARAYLDLHCSVCHQPGGVLQGRMDLRYATPLAKTGLFGASGRSGPQGFLPRLRPGKPSESELFLRLSSLGSDAMPPLGRTSIDERGVALLRAWIVSLTSVTLIAPETMPPPLVDNVPGTVDRKDTAAASTAEKIPTLFLPAKGGLPIPIPVADSSAMFFWKCDSSGPCHALDPKEAEWNARQRAWFLHPSHAWPRGCSWLLLQSRRGVFRFRMVVL